MAEIFGIALDASLGLPLFFFVGLYIALSPCLFPIMPLTVFRIMSKVDETADENYTIEKKKALEWVVLLCSGIFISFALFALTAGTVGLLLISYREFLSFILGLILVVLGIIILFPQIEEKTFARIPVSERVYSFFDKEEFSSFDLFLLGIAYSVIGLPCAAPAYLTLLPLIMGTGNVIYNLLGMGLFGIGLLIPYLILVLLTAEARDRFIKGVKDRFRIIEIITAVLIIIMGILFILPSFGFPNLLF